MLGVILDGRLAVLRQIAACLVYAVLAYIIAGIRTMFWLDDCQASKMKRRCAPPGT